MQPAVESYPIGSIIQRRYQVEDILGRGGFSVVYLVRDSAPAPGQAQPEAARRYALKVLTDRDSQAHRRFLFEGEILTRLNHPALPRIYRVFEDEASHHAFMVMEYIEGINLDRLRKQQPENRFSLAEALVILAPIVEALCYLHAQPSPIIHRDIKPSNVIVRKDRQGAVLVDFSIAKEYEPDATTTAIRHCSPGYGAPEQYSSIGTDQRTDIYGLAATLYALLTGSVPVDALQRATKLASKEMDPLVSIKEFVPSLPAHVAGAIECALSIGMGKRFASVKEFWQALQDTGESKGQKDKRDESKRFQSQHNGALSQRNHESRTGSVRPSRLFVTLMLVLVVSLAAGLGSYFGLPHSSMLEKRSAASSQVHHGVSVKPTPALSSQATADPYPTLAHTYTGTIHDLLTNVTTTLTLTHIQQRNEQISGTFAGLHAHRALTGVLDTSRHLFFTVPGRPPLFFDGAIRSDGNLVGNYCTIDTAGQCVGNYGIWSLAPI